MITIPLVVFACWIIFILYWFFSARSVKSIQETRGWLGGNWYPILYLIGFLFIVNFRFLGSLGIPTEKLATLLLPHTIVLNISVVILLIAGLMIAIIARRTLAENWSAAVALKKDHELITIGLYHYVRHPIYTGLLISLLGTLMLQGEVRAFLGFVLALFALYRKAKREERFLSEEFGEGFAEHAKQTGMFLPRFS